MRMRQAPLLELDPIAERIPLAKIASIDVLVEPVQLRVEHARHNVRLSTALWPASSLPSISGHLGLQVIVMNNDRLPYARATA